MTAQIGDKLTFEGEQYHMASELPLLNKSRTDCEIRFIAGCTACWRGYLATWKIEEDMLYLTGVSGTAEVTDNLRYREEKLRLRPMVKSGEISPMENGRLLREARYKLTETREIDLEFLFGTKDAVPATWITGTIRIPRGKLLEYIHAGYESIFEEDMFLTFSAGRVTDKKIVKNQKK
ncbi:MAG: hypothetical protein JXB49_17400 [Bacteroidales bacterium]|nr:hypothetical protein [Bacteroidales bacterium]MBN2862178.1 hypothetical protein [Bacteroidales bacterium]